METDSSGALVVVVSLTVVSVVAASVVDVVSAIVVVDCVDDCVVVSWEVDDTSVVSSVVPSVVGVSVVDVQSIPILKEKIVIIFIKHCSF